jgi:hypothetical protein
MPGSATPPPEPVSTGGYTYGSSHRVPKDQNEGHRHLNGPWIDGEPARWPIELVGQDKVITLYNSIEDVLGLSTRAAVLTRHEPREL